MSEMAIFRQLRRCHSSLGCRDVKQDERHHSRAEGRSIFLSGRSLQQSNANLTSVEVYVPVSSTLKQQRCRSLCFWKFVSLHPICKIEVHLRPECFLSIREYASYYRLPFWRTVVGQYFELKTLP